MRKLLWFWCSECVYFTYFLAIRCQNGNVHNSFFLLFHWIIAQASQTDRKYDEYDRLHEVIISTGFYGSCERCESQPESTYVAHRLATVDDKTPIVNVSRQFRAGRHINIRIFSLGVLFIGGFTIGTYLLYAQGTKIFFFVK